MFEIHVSAEFEAAHRVAGYNGKCDRLHGHSWTVEACVSGKELDALGMLVDVKSVKKELKAVLDEMDHRYLNELPPFSEGIQPTAENMAKHIYEKLAQSGMFRDGIRLESVCVWESPRSCGVYEPEEE